MNSPSPELPELLGSIHNHADLMQIPEAELPRLAEEIRSTLIQSLAVTGGHLGPNLGVVELSIALHRVFETPRDKIIFDVSHQAYVHKMLTGRAEQIHTIRQYQGLSGFAKMSESPHDSYGAGHAGTALSAALGMCAARDLKGEDYHVVAVAGDAAFTCGTTLEALNNISQTTRRYITILNDNEWAIDKNVGALAKYFNSLQTSETFSWLRDKTASFIEKLGGTQAKEFAFKLEGTTKNLIFPSLLFNKFGLRYFGPLNGHDIPTLIRTLNYIIRDGILSGKAGTLEPGSHSVGLAENGVTYTCEGSNVAVPQEVIDGLVPAAKEFFENALENAQTVYNNANATQEEVNKAWSDLLDAMHLLEFEAGDKEVLLPLINIAEQLAERLDEFKPGTTEGFEEALNAAKDVYAEENPLKADVDEAYDNLQAAIEKLEFRADMSELQSLVDEANTLDPDDYIQDEAFDTFKSVLAEAEELLANANADQADVDAKAEALTRAMAALRKIPNKDELNKLIAEMEQKDLDGYTDRSVAAFKAALSVAKTVAADANADEQAVAKAYTNLEAAANNLVKAEKPGTGNSGKGSTSANIGNAYGAAGVVSAAQGVTSQKAYVVSDTTVNFTLKRGSAYCFKMTVVNGNAMTPSFTVGNGDVLKTQFVAKIGNDYYYRVYAIGTPGQSTGVYTTLPGQNAVKHCTVTIG